MNRKHLGRHEIEGLYWVNGHLMNVHRVKDIRKLRPGLYEIETKWLGTYRVEGGRHAGGGPRDWWIEGGEFKSAIKVAGLADAIKLIETM